MRKYTVLLAIILAVFLTACNRGEWTPTPIGLWVCDDPQITMEVKSNDATHFGSFVENGIEHTVIINFGSLRPNYIISAIENSRSYDEQYFEGGFAVKGDKLTINLIRGGKDFKRNAVFTKIADYEVPDDWEEVNKARSQSCKWYLPEIWPNAERMFIYYGSERNGYIYGEKIYINGAEDVADAVLLPLCVGDMLFFFEDDAEKPCSVGLVKWHENGDIFFSFDVDAKRFEGTSLIGELDGGKRAVLVRMFER